MESLRVTLWLKSEFTFRLFTSMEIVQARSEREGEEIRKLNVVPLFFCYRRLLAGFAAAEVDKVSFSSSLMPFDDLV